MNKLKIELRNSFNIQKENIKKDLIDHIKNKHPNIEMLDETFDESYEDDSLFTHLFIIEYTSIINDEHKDSIGFYFRNSDDDYDTTFEITHTYKFSKIEVIDNIKKLDKIIDDLIRNVLKGKTQEYNIDYNEFYVTTEITKETKENIYTRLN